MCFVHSDISRRTFIEQVSLGAMAATAVSGVGSALAAAEEGVTAVGVGKPDLVVAQAPPAAGGAKTIDGFSKVLHNRFNQDIPAAATVYRNFAKSSLTALKSGDHVAVAQSSDGTFVMADDGTHGPWGRGGMGAHPGWPGPPGQGRPPGPPLQALQRKNYRTER